MLKVLRLAGDDRGTRIAVKDYLDLAALGTIADLVPLRAENRILASHGLRALGEARRPGLRALITVSGMEPGGVLTSVDVSYRLGPRINAGGRIGDAALGAKLLLNQDPVQTQSIAAELDRLNREVVQAVASNEMRERLSSLGADARSSTPAEMRSHIAAEVAKWKRVVEVAKIERQ